MKILYLLRHAKSSWADVSLPDRERPLEHRGERDVAKMSRRWSRRHVKPDLIVSSPAVRALATTKVVAHRLEHTELRVKVDERLYAATPDSLMAVVGSLDDRLDRVMLVGHNPAVVDLARRFDSEITRVPTCALVEFGFDVESWAGIDKTRPARTIFDSPKHRAP